MTSAESAGARDITGLRVAVSASPPVDLIGGVSGWARSSRTGLPVLIAGIGSNVHPTCFDGMVSPPESRSSIRARRTRGAILTAGAELLSEEGVRGITVEGISRRTGLAKTTIYRYWPTRERLVISVLEDVRFDLPTPDTGNSRTDIRIVLKALWDLVREPGNRMTLASMIEAHLDDPALEALHVQFMLASGQPIFDVLTRGLQRGEFDDDLDLEFAFRMLTGPIIAGALVLGAPVDEAFVGHLTVAALGDE